MLPSNKSNEVGNIKNLFDQFFTSGIPIFSDQGIKVTVTEQENSYDVLAELPGVKKEDIHIDFEEDRIMISATKEEQQEINEEDYLYREISSGVVSRTILLPGAIPEKIEASYDNGILNVSVPKKERDDTDNKIKIQVK